MLLVVDIGNTNTHLGLCLDGKVEKAWTMHTKLDGDPREVVHAIRAELPRGTDKHITDAAIASVVPQGDAMWWAVLQKTFRLRPVWVTAKLPLGIEIRYKPAKSVGADRIANAVGGFKKYGGPLIIIDFGTAVTLDVIDAKGNYIGGVIGPGIQLTMNALHAGTALLPKMKLKETLQDPDKVLGQDTVSSMRSGIVFGFCGMIREIVERLKEEQGFKEDVAVVATGGNSAAITKRLPFVKETNPNLTLEGLCEIYARVQGANHDLSGS